jgi:hypothetical protein
MAITKTTEVPKIEVVQTWNIQVATDTVIKEDDVLKSVGQDIGMFCNHSHHQLMGILGHTQLQI